MPTKALTFRKNLKFDNEAGAIVPGYLLIPKDGKAKHPAIYIVTGTVEIMT